jgi:hypothetical protein
MDTKPLVEKIEARAFAARIPIYKLCETAGVSYTTIWRAQRGIGAMNIANVGKLERALDVIEASLGSHQGTERAE